MIRVHKYAVLPCEGFSSEGRFRFSYPIKKLFFFLIHEGIRLTWHKVRASTLQRKIAAERHLVFMEGLVADGEQVVAVAPMDCPAAEYVAVHKKCLTIVPSGKDYSWCLQVLSDHFQRYPENIEALYCYSSYSGMELSFSLKQLLEDAATENWHLKKNTTLHQHFSVLSKEGVDRKPIRVKRKKPNCELFLAGAGAYAYAYVVPYMKGVFHHTIVDLNPLLVAIMQEKFGFSYSDTSCERALKRLADCDSPVLIIATYHSTHVNLAEFAYKCNPRTKIFIEKPPATTVEQLERLLKLRQGGAYIEIGYNRRHIPMILEAKAMLSCCNGPLTMTCIVKELRLPKSHWYYWSTQGTRIAGNLCHWIDLGAYCIKQRPVSVYGVSVPENPAGDEVTVVVNYEDGSRLTVMATDQGNSLRGVQEYIDIRRGDLTVSIDDFLRMKIQRHGRQWIQRALFRDKGHKRMYCQFIDNIQKERAPEYSDMDLFYSTRAYLAARDSIFSSGELIRIDHIF